ncbi:MAG TPA: PilZ domain-containing protein [Spirochaetia bacterium]|nr:PilZ domain-containing protein [Spirochaetia bacterium]
MTLLQTEYNFFSQPDPTTSYVAIGIFAMLILVAVVGSILSNRRRGRSAKKGRFGKGSFRRRAKKAGLFPSHVRVLEHMIKDQSLQTPDRLLEGGSYLDRAMRDELEAIGASSIGEGEKDTRKNTVLQIKAILDSNRTNLNTISSSRNLRIGQEVRLVFERGGSFETAIVSNLANMLGVELPQNDDGPVRPEKGRRMQVTFLRDNDRVYRFVSRVRGIHSVRGKGTLFIEHVNDIKQVQKRKSPRKEYGRPAYFYPVQVMETGTGRKRARQAVVQKNRSILGRVEDISTGGCLLRSQRPLKKGSLIRIDLQTDNRKSMSVFGKVCGVESKPPYGGDMHVMFTRVSQKYMNEIMSFVYGFSE